MCPHLDALATLYMRMFIAASPSAEDVARLVRAADAEGVEPRVIILRAVLRAVNPEQAVAA